MELKFLPEKVRQALYNVDLNFLYEIRFRVGFPIKIRYKNNIFYLSNNGTTLNINDAIICSCTDIDFIINYSTEHSIYAFNDRIKEGYITIENGIRIGICGECVYSNNILQTIKNFTSLNVRISHEIFGCASELLNKIFNNNIIYNTLIVSPPFLGKTTLLKDIASKLNNLNIFSILLIDERGEFENVKGENIDVIKYSNKYFAFNYAIRSMSPALVITDELITESDWKCVHNVVCSGIKIIASCHSDSIFNLVKKEYFNRDIFDRYVILSTQNLGTIEKVYDGKLQLV